MNSCISINQRQNKIIVKIAEMATQEEVIKELTLKVIELKRIYQNENIPIMVQGKILKNYEMEEIQKVIKNELHVNVMFDSPKELGLHGIKKAYEKEIATSETKYIRGSLRSGKKIEFEGSLVIIGDINGGAEVIAGENIIILGNLRGIAHAGAKGNRRAIIVAKEIEAPQLRISDVIKEIEKEDKKYKYAYINNNKIILE